MGLSQRVLLGLKSNEITLGQLADFLYACARLRFIDDELTIVAFRCFEDSVSTNRLSHETINKVLSAAAMLDLRELCEVGSQMVGLVYATMCLGQPAQQTLLP